MMNIFYNGTDSKFHMALDTSNMSYFMSNTLEEATEFVENLAKSNANHCLDYDKR